MTYFHRTFTCEDCPEFELCLRQNRACSLNNLRGDEIVYRNWKAQRNGRKGEEIAIEKFNLKFVDSLIDAYKGDTPVEIKTCQEWQRNGKGRSHGRFTLDKEQHDYLVKHNGLYLFIVLMRDGSMRFRFYKAKKLRFTKRLMWTKIFGGGNGNGF